MRRPFSFVLSFSLFVCLFLVARTVALRGRHRDAYWRLCALTDQYFYRSNASVDAWVQRCRSEARALPKTMTNAAWLNQARDLIAGMDVSHFDVIAPSEHRFVWHGISLNTGIHSRYVDGHLVVYRLTPGSRGAAAGIRPGDEILSLPGIEEVSPYGATFREGTYRLRRNQREFEVQVTASVAGEDGRMTVTTHPSGARVLTIPTFRADYFARDFVREIGRQVMGSPRLVIDLRENSGGDPSAMLRTLSLFFAADTLVATMVQPRRTGPVGVFQDYIASGYHMDLLETFPRIDLRTFAEYPHYDGPVTVLIANETASAAEMFADAFRARARSRIMGWPSAGAVVWAVWHPLGELGLNYSVTLPQAMMLNGRGQDLEGVGIRPDRDLYHDLETSLRGEDAWINAAAR